MNIGIIGGADGPTQIFIAEHAGTYGNVIFFATAVIAVVIISWLVIKKLQQK